jgi:hypothetical protein
MDLLAFARRSNPGLAPRTAHTPHAVRCAARSPNKWRDSSNLILLPVPYAGGGPGGRPAVRQPPFFVRMCLARLLKCAQVCLHVTHA